MISKRLNYNINEIKSGKYFGMFEVHIILCGLLETKKKQLRTWLELIFYKKNSEDI